MKNPFKFIKLITFLFLISLPLLTFSQTFTLSVDDMSKQEKLKAIQLCLQYLMPKPTPEREDKNIIQHFEVEIIDNLKEQ